ncbi:MAG: hypothetical protein LBM71_00495 [Elusimicrobiota bacterium]|jgi:hypothetical protein|nr:hypothetical protein [Elusimicrobiota bacterium]
MFKKLTAAKLFAACSLAFAFLFSCGAISAQTLETISYNPLKAGSYSTLVVRNNLKVASGNNTMISMKANNTETIILSSSLAFGRPIIVKNNVYMEAGTSLILTKDVYVRGKFFVEKIARFNLADGLSTINTTDFTAPAMNVLALNQFVLGGVSFPAPSCKIGWLPLKAVNVYGVAGTYYVLGCL